MKIGFCGAHNSGKTTLVEMLHSAMPDTIIVKEVAREFPREKLLQCKTQYRIIIRQMYSEMFASHFDGNSFCDRTVIDNLAYIYSVCKDITDYGILVGEWARTYDYIFFCSSVGIPLENDGFRFTGKYGEPSQHEIESFILNFMDNNDIPYIILTGDKDERLQKVLEVIG